MSKGKRGNGVTWVLIVVASAAVGLTISELVVRYAFPEATFRPDPLIGPHERARFGTVPNLHGVYAFTKPFRLRTNSRGLREAEEIPYAPEEGEIRALFLGDSFTFGLGVNDGEDFVRASETIVREKLGDRVVRFINMGIPASGPSVQYLHFLEEGRRYRPDIVVVQVCDNDLHDDYRNNIFKVEDGLLVRNPRPQPRLERFGIFPVYQWLIQHSTLCNLLRAFAKRRLGLEKGYAERKGEVYERADRVTRVVWMSLIDAIRREGAIPIFLLADNHVTHLAEERARTFSLVKDVCKKKDVRIINPRTAIEAHFSNNIFDAYVSKYDQHWGREGNVVVGRVVADVLTPIIVERAERKARPKARPMLDRTHRSSALP